ncbi:hypothetical protein QO259_01725 [Salinicola sp. JS01]|uniref:hypothetical protein n=1 Tax=Salinicola sp. JS01 TaxID=3050071 RepID=UPI00255BCB37|nr:hypothetical protein [Salinicola sp. JS01]WIX33403.1 hypothetical protein QO259_01725 [Salinicola sp. JS01]
MPCPTRTQHPLCRFSQASLAIAVTASLALTSLSAQASSPASWEDQTRDVIAQCTDASQFSDAEPAGAPVLFDDEAGTTALLLKGHYPQQHMNGREGQELCLYLRASQEVFIAPADKLTAGPDALPDAPTDTTDDSGKSGGAGGNDTATDDAATAPTDSNEKAP